MPLPKPPASLDDSCTVIHGNTLYSYSPEAFLSLDLTEGAEWKKLKMGEKVSGGVCVGTKPGDDSQAALFIVGGTGGTTGLQKFTYTTGEWTSVTPSSQVTKDRRWHGATYLRANDAIIVYAGSQDGVEGPSTETFSIQASEPYEANAYGSSGHAATNPILLNWSDADVVLVGGDSASVAASLFNPAAGWRASGASLSTPLADSAAVQTIIIDGDDGSKSLLAFDLTQTPNQVSRYVLQDASGVPVSNSDPVSKGKRDLTLNDWPEYNSTLAPTTARSNYALAQGQDGMVVFTGGNDEEPLAIFNAFDNSWVDSNTMFMDSDQKILSDTTTSADSSSATATATSSKKTSSGTATTETATSGTASSTSASASKTGTETVSGTASGTTSGTASGTASGTSTSGTATSGTSTSGSLTSEAASSTDFSSIVSNTASAAAEESAATTTDAAAIAAGGKSSSSGPGANAILGITLGTIIAFLALLGLILFCIRRRKAQQNHTEAGHARRDSGPALDEKDPSAFAVNTLPPPSPGYFRGHQQRPSVESVSSMAILTGRIGQPKSNLNKQSSAEDANTRGNPMPQEPDAPVLHGMDEKGVQFDPTVAQPRNGPIDSQDGTRRSSGWNRYWSGGSALQILGFGAPKRVTAGSDISSRYSEAAPPYNPRVTQDSATVPPLNFDGRPEFNRVNSGSPVVSQYSSHIPFKDGVAGKIERPSSRDSAGYSSGIPESVNEAWDPNELEKQPWGSARAPSSAYTPSFYYGTPLAPSEAGVRQAPQPGVSTQPQLAMASTSSDMSWLNLGEQNRL